MAILNVCSASQNQQQLLNYQKWERIVEPRVRCQIRYMDEDDKQAAARGHLRMTQPDHRFNPLLIFWLNKNPLQAF